MAWTDLCGSVRFSMPLDGATFWHASGWTIRVGLDRARLHESRYWSEKKRRVFHKLVLDAAYAAIDAIQSGRLYKRRDEIWDDGSWIKYFLRQDHREKRTILITISHFHFFDPGTPPDGPNGRRSPLPVDLLTLHVSGSGRRYRIDRIEGIAPMPRPPARNRIVSLLEQLSRHPGNGGYLDIVGRPRPDGRTGRISVSVGGTDNALYYAPRGLNSGAQVLLEFDSLYRKGTGAATPRSGLLTQLRQTLAKVGLRSRAKTIPPGHGSLKTSRSSSGAEEFTYSVVLHDTSAWPSIAAQTRLQLQNRPIRPHDLQ